MHCSQKEAAGLKVSQGLWADDLSDAKHEQTQPRRPRTGVVGNAGRTTGECS
jgi:hypothetical protein